jgi:RNA polymerase sigma-70 factor (ECF subfamily)
MTTQEPLQTFPNLGSEPSDHSLLRRFRHGSQDAATQLYLRYAQRLRALAQAQCSADLARRVDVDDIVQSVFGSFFRRASQGCYDVPAGEELWRLLLVIALHKIRDQGSFHRAARRDVRRTTGGEALDQSLEARGNQAEIAFLETVVQEALEKLAPLHRRVVECRLEGYEVAEIAQKVERSKRTVERILQEARGELDALLGREC